jgi:hypothetical protein
MSATGPEYRLAINEKLRVMREFRKIGNSD